MRAFLTCALDIGRGGLSFPTYVGWPALQALPDGKGGIDRWANLSAVALAHLLRHETAALSCPLRDHTPAPHVLMKRARAIGRVLGEIGELVPGLSEVIWPCPPWGPWEGDRRYLDGLASTILGAAPRKWREDYSLSVLPTSRMHDEIMFITVLQVFELLFDVIATDLQCSIDMVLACRFKACAELFDLQCRRLAISSFLFRILSTMTPSAFMQFRDRTVGASAIQSRAYKRMEAVCSRPDEQRLASIAFAAVPELVLGGRIGQPTLEDALMHVLSDVQPTREITEMLAALKRFQIEVQRWKYIHYSLARRIIGDLPGTGYTVGSPYLEKELARPLLRLPESVGGP